MAINFLSCFHKRKEDIDFCLLHTIEGSHVVIFSMFGKGEKHKLSLTNNFSHLVSLCYCISQMLEGWSWLSEMPNNCRKWSFQKYTLDCFVIQTDVKSSSHPHHLQRYIYVMTLSFVKRARLPASSHRLQFLSFVFIAHSSYPLINVRVP